MEVSQVGSQPCSRDGAPIKTRDTKAQGTSPVGNTPGGLSRAIAERGQHCPPSARRGQLEAPLMEPSWTLSREPLPLGNLNLSPLL